MEFDTLDSNGHKIELWVICGPIGQNVSRFTVGNKTMPKKGNIGKDTWVKCNSLFHVMNLKCFYVGKIIFDSLLKQARQW